jgi:hypothetical protein
MSVSHYLIFGDLHGRILPAFCLAMAWEREHGIRLDGLLQVGDLGYFPDPSRLDKATARHAAHDPMELGACLVAEPNREADAVFRGEEDLHRSSGSRRAITRTSMPWPLMSRTETGGRRASPWTPICSPDASGTGGSKHYPARFWWGRSGGSTTGHRTPADALPSGAEYGTGA